MSNTALIVNRRLMIGRNFNGSPLDTPPTTAKVVINPAADCPCCTGKVDSCSGDCAFGGGTQWYEPVRPFDGSYSPPEGSEECCLPKQWFVKVGGATPQTIDGYSAAGTISASTCVPYLSFLTYPNGGGAHHYQVKAVPIGRVSITSPIGAEASTTTADVDIYLYQPGGLKTDHVSAAGNVANPTADWRMAVTVTDNCNNLGILWETDSSVVIIENSAPPLLAGGLAAPIVAACASQYDLDGTPATGGYDGPPNLSIFPARFPWYGGTATVKPCCPQPPQSSPCDISDPNHTWYQGIRCGTNEIVDVWARDDWLTFTDGVSGVYLIPHRDWCVYFSQSLSAQIHLVPPKWKWITQGGAFDDCAACLGAIGSYVQAYDCDTDAPIDDLWILQSNVPDLAKTYRIGGWCVYFPNLGSPLPDGVAAFDPGTLTPIADCAHCSPVACEDVTPAGDVDLSFLWTGCVILPPPPTSVTVSPEATRWYGSTDLGGGYSFVVEIICSEGDWVLNWEFDTPSGIGQAGTLTKPRYTNSPADAPSMWTPVSSPCGAIPEVHSV